MGGSSSDPSQSARVLGAGVDPAMAAQLIAEGVAQAMNCTAFALLTWVPAFVATALAVRRRAGEVMHR